MKYCIQRFYREDPTTQDPNGRPVYEYLTRLGFEVNPNKEEIVAFSELTAEAVCAGLEDINFDTNTYFSYHPIS